MSTVNSHIPLALPVVLGHHRKEKTPDLCNRYLTIKINNHIKAVVVEPHQIKGPYNLWPIRIYIFFYNNTCGGCCLLICQNMRPLSWDTNNIDVRYFPLTLSLDRIILTNRSTYLSFFELWLLWLLDNNLAEWHILLIPTEGDKSLLCTCLACEGSLTFLGDKHTPAFAVANVIYDDLIMIMYWMVHLCSTYNTSYMRLDYFLVRFTYRVFVTASKASDIFYGASSKFLNNLLEDLRPNAT